MEQAEHCRCSRPDLWGTGDSRCCIGCGFIAAPDTNLTRKRKAEEAEVSTDDGKRAAPPSSLRTPFNYKELEHASTVRLLRLSPGSHEDEIVGDVFHANIADPPNYEAVSYTWGGTTLDQELQTTTGVIKITNNCFSALRDLRHARRERILWIDAICIAQANNLEKNHQIPLMPKIYARATQVLIYLANQATFGDAETLFALLRRSKDTPDGTRFGHQLATLLSLPWFSRIWVLQEVAMAYHAMVIVGSATLDWNCLSIANIQSLGLKSTDVAGRVPAVLRMPKCHSPLKDPASLIAMARSCLSSDPRDRIYALLGLLDERSGINLTPDYNRPAKDVYTDVAVQYLETYNCLDFLSEAGVHKISLASTFAINTSYNIRILTRLRTSINNAIAQLQKIAMTLDELNSELLGKNTQTFEAELRSLYSKLVEKISVLRRFVESTPERDIPCGCLIPNNFFTSISRAIKELGTQEINLLWVAETRELCKGWEEKLRSAKSQCLGSEHEAKSRILNKFIRCLGPALNPAHIPTERDDTDALEKILDLPSWVPDYRLHPRLLSFTRWKPDVFAKRHVARFHAYSQYRPTPSLEVEAVFIEKFERTKHVPGQHVKSGYANFNISGEFSWDQISLSSEFSESLIETAHGATLDDIGKFAKGRQMVFTNKSVAIIPMNLLPGDVIAVLYGGTVPFLLRPNRSERDRFQFIGECYLHGVRGPQFAPDYTKLLGWFKDDVMGQVREGGLPWKTIFLV